MPDNNESLNFGKKILNYVKKWFRKVTTYTNANLKENLNAKRVKHVKKVEPTKQQEELLKSHGVICNAIGSELVVVRNDDGCMLFKLTEENGIEQIDLGNVYKAKNISRIFKELFIIEGDNKVEMIRFNPDIDEKWESLEIYKKHQIGQKDPLNRNIRWVRFWYHDDRTPETFYEDEFGWGIPNFKLILNK